MYGFDKKTCPVLKKCRREAVFAPMKIFSMILLALFAAGGFYVMKNSIVILWNIAGGIFGVVGIFCFAWQIFYVSRGMAETASYLKSLSDEEYGKLCSQIYLTESSSEPAYFLDGFFFAPSSPIVAAYDEITDCKIRDIRTNGVHSGYRVIISLRGKKREINLSGYQKFDPGFFQSELENRIIQIRH